MLLHKAEARQQRGKRPAMLHAPGEFRVAALDGALLEALCDRGVHGFHENLRLGQAGGDHFKDAPDARVLDCGCGGGANIRTLLKKCPKGIVKGIDYSAVSAEQARKRNADAIQAGRCAVWQGSVEQIIFASGWFDAVTAFETVYFWPGLVPCFREVYRVLKPDGTFLICNECGGDIPGDEKWTQRISGMRIYKDTQLKAALEEAGFRDVQIYKHKRDWLCVLARK